MGFASGTVSFRRFAVLGQSQEAVDQALLDKLAEHALKPGEFGVPEEVEYGWCGGRHIFDGQFGFEHNVFNDSLVCALRIDTNTVPGSLKKAYEAIEEEALAKANPSGFLSKAQKKEVKETVRAKIEEEMRGGRFRRSKMLPVLWDLPGQTLYSTASGATLEKLMELFERSFGLEIKPLTAGSLGLHSMEEQHKRRDYEDLKPTRFVPGPDGEGQFPEYPWVSKGPEPKDFLGNEFLLWLWHEADAKMGVVKLEGVGDVALFIDRSLDLDCAYGQTGRDGLRGTGPSRMPEARDGLRSGKLPRKAGFVMDFARQEYRFNINAETFAVGSLALPDVEEADTPRKLFEERITLLRDFCGAIDGFYAAFLKVRTSSAWEGQTGAIRRWITQAPKPVSAVA